MAARKARTLTKQEIFRILRENPGLLEQHAVRKIGLFGSYARGRPKEGSDLDFLVEFERSTYDNFIGLANGLEQLFGRRVDILTPEGLDSIRVKNVADGIRKSLAYG